MNTSRSITFLTPVALFVAAITIIAAVIVPAVRTIATIRSATIAEHESLERRYRQGRVLSRVLRDYAIVRSDIDALGQQIPGEREALAFVQRIEGIASAHRLTEAVALDRTGGTASGAGLLRVPFQVDVEGTFPNALAALRDFERLPLPPAIPRITITLTDDILSPNALPFARVRMSIRAATAWRK